MDAPRLHTLETFDALGSFDPERSAAEGHLHLFGATLRMFMLSIGAPYDLWVAMLIAQKERPFVFKTLRTLEAMMRRILLILAARDERPLEPFLAKKTRGPARGITASGSERMKYAVGPVSGPLPIYFSFAPSAPKLGVEVGVGASGSDSGAAGCRRIVSPISGQEPINATPILVRLEALIRVYEDPMTYVMRLRQKLAQAQARAARDVRDFCARIIRVPRFLDLHLRSALRDTEDDSKAASGQIGSHVIGPTGSDTG